MAENQDFLTNLNDFGISLQQTEERFDVPPIVRQKLLSNFVGSIVILCSTSFKDQKFLQFNESGPFTHSPTWAFTPP